MPHLLELGLDVLRTIVQYLKHYVVILRRVNRQFRNICGKMYRNYFRKSNARTSSIFWSGNRTTCWLNNVVKHQLPVRIRWIDSNIFSLHIEDDSSDIVFTASCQIYLPEVFIALCTTDGSILLSVLKFCDSQSIVELIRYCKYLHCDLAEEIYDKFCDSQKILTHSLALFITKIDRMCNIFSPRHLQKYCDDDDEMILIFGELIKHDSKFMISILANPKYKLTERVLIMLIKFANRYNILYDLMQLLSQRVSQSNRLMTIATSMTDIAFDAWLYT
jgi:hypothetical protein